MKKIFLISFWVLSAAAVCGQDSTSAPRKNFKHALQFSMNFLTLQTFNNGMVAIKHNLDNFTALRLAFWLNGNFDSEALFSGKDTTKSESFTAKLYLQYLSHSKMTDNFSFYWGGGPYYSKTLYKAHYYSHTNKWEVGLGALLGLEWMVHKRITIDAEYGIQVGREKSSRNYYDGNVFNTTSWLIDTYSLFHFGASVYF